MDASNTGNTNQYNNISALDAETLCISLPQLKPPILTNNIKTSQVILLALVCHFMKATVIQQLPLLVKLVSTLPMQERKLATLRRSLATKFCLKYSINQP